MHLGLIIGLPTNRPILLPKRGSPRILHTSLNYELQRKNVFITNVIFAGVDTPFVDGRNYETYKRGGKLMHPSKIADLVVGNLLRPRQNLVMGSPINYWVSRLSMMAPSFFQNIIERRNQSPTD